MYLLYALCILELRVLPFNNIFISLDLFDFSGLLDPQIMPCQFNHCSGQYAWQTLIAYDATIRLCLHAWERGCTEAPEFLRDECFILRSAFG